MHFSRRSRAFTLIELLVVIAIIGLLASIIMASLSSARSKARDAERKEELSQLSRALELYYNDYGSYPVSSCITTWSCWSSLLSGTYIGQMPTDPAQADNGSACSVKDGSRLFSYYSDTGQRYLLVTNLENTPAQDNNYYTGNYGCTYFGNWAIKVGF